MTNLNFKSGGIISIIVGNASFVHEYREHPQVKWLQAKDFATFQELNNALPKETKLVIITQGIPQSLYLWITGTYCKHKNLIFLVRNSNHAIFEALRKYLPEDNGVSQEEAKTTREKGKLEPLIPFLDFTKSNSENARMLLQKAVELGIRTTEGSLVQLASLRRRKQSATAVPNSSRSQLDISVEVLEQSIKGLTDIRDYLIATVEENRMLRNKVEKFKKVMED